MRKFLPFLLACLLVAPALADPRQEVARVLDDFHRAASEADGERYFGHFSKDAIFLGTDLSERWNLEQFKAYAMPIFARGKGWTYRPTFRKIYLAPDGQTAWFDEVLENDNYGQTRGSGVLVKDGSDWKVAQYHLTVPIPNELLDKVVEMIGK
ncbi:MAG: nuclear transport factor 2 family protein [Candidatus Eremiobacteraeota bacterium]|nr:nuclear transport factor 2 family protein [Candidatus Eremiobacteraeota bacterium]